MANKSQALNMTHDWNKLQRWGLARSVHRDLANQLKYSVFPVHLRAVDKEKGHSNNEMINFISTAL